MVSEGLVLAFAGGTLGVLLAYWIVALFEIRTASGALLTLTLEPDVRVIGFATLTVMLLFLGWSYEHQANELALLLLALPVLVCASQFGDIAIVRC